MMQEKGTLKIYRVSQARQIARPMVSSRVSAGFPSPAEDYIEGYIDLNMTVIRNPLATIYVRVSGDSMCNIGIYPDCLLVVDRSLETHDGDIVIARIFDELCVKRLSIGNDGRVRLLPENENYQPIEVTEIMDFEVWGKVLYSIQPH
jgi:DNA polymerase V